MKHFTSFSPSMLKTFEQCEKKFYYKYVQGINLPVDDTKTQIGKNIHAIASYYLKNYNTDKLETALTNEEMGIWKNLKNNEYFNKKVLKSEYSLMTKVGEYWLNGRFDALVQDGEKFYILDYKTGSIPKKPETDFQTMVYLLIADKFLKNYKELNFIYIDLKNNKNLKIKFNNEKKSEYEKLLKTILDKITKCNLLSVYNTSNSKCLCEYKKLCQKFY